MALYPFDDEPIRKPPGRRVSVDGVITWHNARDQYHRTDGPAIETPEGALFWCQNDKWHRLDGPAIIDANGKKEWWIRGKSYSEAAFNAHPQVRALQDKKEGPAAIAAASRLQQDAVVRTPKLNLGPKR